MTAHTERHKGNGQSHGELERQKELAKNKIIFVLRDLGLDIPQMPLEETKPEDASSSRARKTLGRVSCTDL